MTNGIYITIFSDKFQTQRKKQTNSKVSLTLSHYTRPHLEYGCSFLVKDKLGLQIIL